MRAIAAQRHQQRRRQLGASDLYSAGLDASWEIDVFGGVRREFEAAHADVARSEDDLRDVLVSLAAEVALSYVDVRSFQARLAIAQANLEAQDETESIVGWRVQAGLATELELERARSNAAQTRAQIPTLRDEPGAGAQRTRGADRRAARRARRGARRAAPGSAYTARGRGRRARRRRSRSDPTCGAPRRSSRRRPRASASRPRAPIRA